jgi:hypothetical protein
VLDLVVLQQGMAHRPSATNLGAHRLAEQAAGLHITCDFAAAAAAYVKHKLDR